MLLYEAMGLVDTAQTVPIFRERLFQFACLGVPLVKYLHTRGPIADVTF